MNWFINQEVELTKGAIAGEKRTNITPLAYPGSANAHQWCVYVKNHGIPLDLTGNTVTAYFQRSDGNVVVVQGDTIDNMAYVIIPAEVYAISGIVKAYMDVVLAGSAITPVAGITFNVPQNMSGDIIDPGEVIPASLEELLAEIDAMRQATAEARAVVSSSVRYDTAQTLTDAQKERARWNIDAANANDVVDLKSALDESRLKRTIYGKNVVITDGAENGIVETVLEFLPIQSGTGDPSSTNIRELSGRNSVDITINNEATAINLGTTIYSGNLNINTGVLTETYGYLDCTNVDWHLSGNKFWVYAGSMKNVSGGSVGYCNMYKPIKGIANNNGEISFGDSRYSSSPRIVIVDSNYSTVEQFKEYLATMANNGTPLIVVYPLATPLTSEIAPISYDIITGENTISTTADDMNITYYVNLSKYLKVVPQDEKIILFNIPDRSDISSLLNTALMATGINVVEVPSGNYTISSTVTIPAGKTVIFQGDYANASITPTTITPAENGITMFLFETESHLEGGYFDLGSYENVVAFKIDCHNSGKQRITIKKSKIVGGRENTTHVFSQTGVFVECDYASDETVTAYGYLVFAEFDLWIDMVGYAYHFHRQTSAGSGSSTSGVWLTENNIYGYIRHCTRYIWYDFSDGNFANNDSIIGATFQAGSLYSGESNYPGVNIFGSGIIIAGKFWDFSGVHNHPAVYFEHGATNNYIMRRCSVEDYAMTNGLLTSNYTAQTLSRINAYRFINIEKKEKIGDVVNKSYQVGDIIYLNIQFKVGTEVAANDTIFDIVTDALAGEYIFPCTIASGASRGSVHIYRPSGANYPVIRATTTIIANNAWMWLTGVIVSKRIESWTMSS